MEHYERALKTLEYDKILAMLAERAPTEGAKELALALRPSDSPDRILRMQRETTEAKAMQAVKGMPSFGMIKDIRDAADRAEKGATLSQRELLDIANVLKTSRSLLEYSRTDRRETTSIPVSAARADLPSAKTWQRPAWPKA